MGAFFAIISFFDITDKFGGSAGKLTDLIVDCAIQVIYTVRARLREKAIDLSDFCQSPSEFNLLARCMLYYFDLLERASPVIEELLFWLCLHLKLARSSTTFVRHVHWVAWQSIVLNDRVLRATVR